MTTHTPGRNPGHYTRHCGGFAVTALSDGFFETRPGDVLLGIPPEDAEALIAARFRGPGLRIHINAYLVQGSGRTVLIDAGTGGKMGPTAGDLLRNLAAVGVQPGDVEAVLLTHFHGDHSGGLTDAQGRAVFPRAELGYAPEEAAYWLSAAAEQAAPEAKRPGFQSARAAAAAYENRTRAIESEALPGITRVFLPGHTPGHSGWQVGEGPGAVLIWGDIMHAPDIQAPRPAVSVGFDVDPVQAMATRRAILARAADERLSVAGMHMHFPGFCHVARDGDGYAIIPEQWKPEP